MDEWDEKERRGYEQAVLKVEGPYVDSGKEVENRHKQAQKLHATVYLVVAIPDHIFGYKDPQVLIRRGLVPKKPVSKWKGSSPEYDWDAVTADYLADNNASDQWVYKGTKAEVLVVDVGVESVVEAIEHYEDEQEAAVLQVMSDATARKAEKNAVEWCDLVQHELNGLLATGKTWEDAVKSLRVNDASTFRRKDLCSTLPEE